METTKILNNIRLINVTFHAATAAERRTRREIDAANTMQQRYDVTLAAIAAPWRSPREISTAIAGTAETLAPRVFGTYRKNS